MKRNLIVFTDLDGTLLDHRSYGIRAALPAIDLLIRRGFPVIPVSSKTAAEMRRWIRLLTLQGPFICENGCGVVIPVGTFDEKPQMAKEIGGEWRISLGTGIEQVRKGLKILSAKAGFSYRSFDEMTVEELSSLTGLTGDELQDSLIREYDLPFVIDSDGDEADIAEKADKMGFHFTRGGRFHHLTGGCHKGKAVGTLTELYRIKQPDPVFVAIGDSFNDLPMFEAVDMAFLVQKPDGTYDPAIPEGAAVKVRGAGPRGWRAAVEEVMNLD